MEERSPKRRRISPDEDNAELRKTPRRASFMSPTKASLARFNPNLLKSPLLSKSPRRPPSRRNSQWQADTMEPSLEDLARDNAALAASLEHQESNPSPRPASRNSLFDDLDLDNSRARQPDTLDKPNSTSQPETVRLTEPELSRPEQQPDPAKVKEKEELLNELKLLRQQVNRHERVAERIERGGKDSGIQDSTVVELVQILDDDQTSKKSSAPKQVVSDLLSAFLPFATVPLVNQLDVEEDEDPVPSHNPLELKDPLPCLQLFTPLNFSSTLDLPQYKGEFQNQLHHLRIQGAESLFHADVDIRVTSLASNPTKPHVSYLSVPSISHWAQPELQQWMGSRCKARDVRTLLYSFGSYWDIAVRRAQCWARCEKAFAPLLDDRGEAEKENMEQNDSDGKFSEVQLLPHLGRTSLLFRNDDVALRISWRLKFDWTGEAESDVSASAAFAPLYHDLDGRGSLGKVPDTFARLLHSKGVFGAIEATASVLFS